VHGSAPDIAGKGLANPFGAILSAALLVERLGDTVKAGVIRAAVRRAVIARQCTIDIGGHLSTEDAGAAVRGEIC
jgi:3-isopropylmalate dehydrogenase